MEAEDCAICLETLDAPSKLSCGHAYHEHCILSAIAHGSLRCPQCRSPVSEPRRARRAVARFQRIHGMSHDDFSTPRASLFERPMMASYLFPGERKLVVLVWSGTIGLSTVSAAMEAAQDLEELGEHRAEGPCAAQPHTSPFYLPLEKPAAGAGFGAEPQRSRPRRRRSPRLQRVQWFLPMHIGFG